MNVAALAVMESNWREAGFTSPNTTVYPWLWLWDSCFHGLIWHHLGRTDRALVELASVFEDQGSAGFVPHMRYVDAPEEAADFWGRSGTSAITQPPMFGHAVAELVRAGVDVGPLADQASLAIRHLFDRPPTPSGLVPIFHPWESGCDDSPRWDSGRFFDASRWHHDKGRFVEGLRFDADGAPIANATFTVGSVGFNALVAFNASELVSIGVGELSPDRDRLVAAIADRYDDEAGTWVDDSHLLGAAVRTLDAHLALLVADPEVVDRRAPDLVDTEVFGAPFGPAGVAQTEAARRDDQYWRGPSWPQLSYLMWLACSRSGRAEAEQIASSLRAGAIGSGFSEYWNPETGAGLGACPQSWAGLSAIVG